LPSYLALFALDCFACANQLVSLRLERREVLSNLAVKPALGRGLGGRRSLILDLRLAELLLHVLDVTVDGAKPCADGDALGGDVDGFLLDRNVLITK
jgi:hypothetical protein